MGGLGPLQERAAVPDTVCRQSSCSRCVVSTAPGLAGKLGLGNQQRKYVMQALELQ